MSEIRSKGAAHCKCKTVRHRVGQIEYFYVLYLYFHLWVVYVYTHRLIRLVQPDRQGILIHKQPQTLVFRMEA